MVSFPNRLAVWLRPIFFLGQNKVSMTGVVLTTSSGITLVVFWIVELLSRRAVHPYVGILLFLILPTVFVLGLALIPAGALLERLRLKRRGELPRIYPAIDLGTPIIRRTAVFVTGATMLNFAMFGMASYKGLEYMDSVGFCGEACHSVMAPELAAYRNSPHSRVNCVGCHIGPGASWFVKSKLSGVRQVFAVTFKTYSRPIPSPVHALRPARETCEQCHWPQKFQGDRLVVKNRYAEDEKNTRLTTVLLMKIGGRTSAGSVGIHGRHLDEGSRISYVAVDDRRMKIATISYKDDAGHLQEYVSSEIKATPQQLARGETRTMDCVDCHNRPTHAFELPEGAMDKAMSSGAVSTDLPFIKKKSVEFLKMAYPDQETARVKLAEQLTAYYQKTYPDLAKQKGPEIQRAITAVQEIYSRNVFPSMRLTWGTHPNHIGHTDSPGCFRCHDGNHTTASGKVVSNECDACHSLLAMEEEDPAVLGQLGLK